MDLNKLTAARIIELHNALAPTGITPLAVSTDKAKAIAAMNVAVAPKQIAVALKDTPFNVRQALRAARKDGKIAHTMKTRWDLPLCVVIDLFPALVPAAPAPVAKPKATKKQAAALAALEAPMPPAEPVAAAAE